MSLKIHRLVRGSLVHYSISVTVQLYALEGQARSSHYQFILPLIILSPKHKNVVRAIFEFFEWIQKIVTRGHSLQYKCYINV